MAAAPFARETHAARREALMGRMAGGVAIFATAPPAVYSNDVEYRYRPDSDFYYLTGFREPEAVAVLVPHGGGMRYVLFVRPRDPERELWTGPRAGVEGARETYGADAAFPIEQLEPELGRLLKAADSVYFAFGRDHDRGECILRLIRAAQSERPRTGAGPVAVLDPATLLHEMRMRKTAEELALMREAARISSIAHEHAMRAAGPGQYEYEVEALVESTFRRHGATGPAYPTIAASGANATVLHYQDNACRMEANDLLLLDAGAEFGCYNADITRTFPVGRRFSPVQRELYALVLAAQRAAIDAVRPGAPYDEPHRCAIRVLCDGLATLGLLEGPTDRLIESEEYRRYFMHRTSHWLGLDVHDVGVYRPGGSARILEPGMVLTVEPGLYIAADAKEAPERFRGIGIRIEDDVLVTADGHEVLSAAVPTDIADIEALRDAGSP
jgi:Xaa-Pro aminopeptidase